MRRVVGDPLRSDTQEQRGCARRGLVSPGSLAVGNLTSFVPSWMDNRSTLKFWNHQPRLMHPTSFATTRLPSPSGIKGTYEPARNLMLALNDGRSVLLVGVYCIGHDKSQCSPDPTSTDTMHILTIALLPKARIRLQSCNWWGLISRRAPRTDRSFDAWLRYALRTHTKPSFPPTWTSIKMRPIVFDVAQNSKILHMEPAAYELLQRSRPRFIQAGL